MNDLTDTELNRVRRRFIDLIKSFYVEEPDAERLSRWRGIVTALTRESINPQMDSGVRELDRMLTEMKLDVIKDEYYELFVNPYSDHLAHTTLSFFVDGHDFGQSLINFRSFLMEADLVKKDNVHECEDSAVFMLDVLDALIEEEKIDPESSRARQNELLTEYLDPFTVHFSQEMQQNEKAHFYKACSLFFAGYIDLEKGLITP